MEIALVEYFPEHGFEVWITGQIKLGSGMGDVFDTYEDALDYAKDCSIPIVDITHIPTTYMDDDNALRAFLCRFVELTANGEIISIKGSHEENTHNDAK